ncbi:hypothetical protein DSL92_06210 [Billgrantia gudaonensis]|uniref:Uncharacterized protein n=1 Tax=Billgrantia gudaonensis TaxID=376427 RepID=A0A3S0NDY3_9GAMM|nr:hypothetical protein DSL92_06210 [Halomonas gudaonensis]
MDAINRELIERIRNPQWRYFVQEYLGTGSIGLLRKKGIPAGRQESEQSMSSNNIKQYEQYFDSGTYDRRYPLPNRRVMSILESLVTPDSIILDFGCGSGLPITVGRANQACHRFRYLLSGSCQCSSAFTMVSFIGIG